MSFCSQQPNLRKLSRNPGQHVKHLLDKLNIRYTLKQSPPQQLSLLRVLKNPLLLLHTKSQCLDEKARPSMTSGRLGKSHDSNRRRSDSGVDTCGSTSLWYHCNMQAVCTGGDNVADLYKTAVTTLPRRLQQATDGRSSGTQSAARRRRCS